MTDGSDYFVNHKRARTFPWSLYHLPLEESLAGFLHGVSERQSDASILVLGCGMLHEIDRAPPSLRFTVADIDPRAIDAVMARRIPGVVGSILVTPDAPIPTPDGGFAAIYAKEVIEHVIAWPEWLADLKRVLAPGGALWLSTPNYGEPWLSTLESTVLEVIARRSGYTRAGMHPSRFTRASLEAALRGAGFVDVEVRPCAWRLALSASARTRVTRQTP